VAFPDGRAVVVYEDHYSIRLRAYSPDADTWMDEVEVAPSTPCYAERPDAIPLSNGKTAVAWKAGVAYVSCGGPYLRHFGLNGAPEGDPVQVTQGNNVVGPPALAELQNGDVVVVWVHYSEDMATVTVKGRYMNGGQGPPPFVILDGLHSPLHVEGLPGGGFLFAASLSDGIVPDETRVLLFPPGGTAPESWFSLEGVSASSLTLLASGEIVFVASSELKEKDQHDILLYRVGLDGTVLDSAVVVNMPREGSQQRPDLAVGPDGTALVVWEDYSWCNLLHFGGWGDQRRIMGRRVKLW